MTEIIIDNLPFVLSSLFVFLVWLIRLETKVKENEKDLKQFKEKQDTENLKIDVRYEKNIEFFTEIKTRLGKVENDLTWLKRNWNKR